MGVVAGTIAAVLAGWLLGAAPAAAEFGGLPGYAGSDACRACHPKEYAQWRLTPHARMLVDATRDPFAVLADDFNENIPFSEGDIVYSVGSHWIQKYLTRIDGVLYVLPKYWNIAERRWEPYSIWNWREQPYNIHCDGCHAVGFDPETESFFEPGVGCEACHGPGQEHVRTGGRLTAIVNPANLDADRAQMVCMACHTDGMDKATETYPFPVGFVPGEDLNDYFTEFFMPKPKSKSWYWGTMDLRERKRMWYFFQSKFYSTSRACEVCGFDRGITQHRERYMSPSEYCGTCHKVRYENFFEHSGHRPGKVGCRDCHVPEIAHTPDGGRAYSIHDHKFDFSQPEPACTECHEPADVEGKGDRCGYHTPDFHLTRVKYPREMTVPEACVYCHTTELKESRDEGWAREAIPRTVNRFLVD
ncbi:MAG: hypothetical protein Kow0092_16240 [Deferrisomatales bacterium]